MPVTCSVGYDAGQLESSLSSCQLPCGTASGVSRSVVISRYFYASTIILRRTAVGTSSLLIRLAQALNSSTATDPIADILSQLEVRSWVERAVQACFNFTIMIVDVLQHDQTVYT
jgi:hypothetical protein